MSRKLEGWYGIAEDFLIREPEKSGLEVARLESNSWPDNDRLEGIVGTGMPGTMVSELVSGGLGGPRGN